MTMREYMLGNVAIARGLLEGGVQVIAGYPGTPSSNYRHACFPKTGTSISNGRLMKRLQWKLQSGLHGLESGSVVTMKHVGLNVAAILS